MFLRRKFPPAVGGRQTNEMQDVVGNITTLLNARRGASSFMQTFGLDIAHFRAQDDAIDALKEQVRQNLERYETRIDVIEVEEQYDASGKPYLEIHAALKTTGERLRIVSATSGRAFQIEPYSPDAEED